MGTEVVVHAAETSRLCFWVLVVGNDVDWTIVIWGRDPGVLVICWRLSCWNVELSRALYSLWKGLRVAYTVLWYTSPGSIMHSHWHWVPELTKNSWKKDNREKEVMGKIIFIRCASRIGAEKINYKHVADHWVMSCREQERESRAPRRNTIHWIYVATQPVRRSIIFDLRRSQYEYLQ